MTDDSPPPPSYAEAMSDANAAPRAQPVPTRLLDIIFDPHSTNGMFLSQAHTISPEELRTFQLKLAESVGRPIHPGLHDNSSEVAARLLVVINTNLTKLSAELQKDNTTSPHSSTNEKTFAQSIQSLQNLCGQAIAQSGRLAATLASSLDRFDQIIVPICQDNDISDELKIAKITQFIEECTVIISSTTAVARNLDNIKHDISSLIAKLNEWGAKDKTKKHRQLKTIHEELLMVSSKSALQAVTSRELLMLGGVSLASISYAGTLFTTSAHGWLILLGTISSTLAVGTAMKLAQATSFSPDIQQTVNDKGHQLEAIEAEVQAALNVHNKVIDICGALNYALDRHSEPTSKMGESVLGDVRSLKAYFENERTQMQREYSAVMLRFENGAYKSMSSNLRLYADVIDSGLSFFS